MAVKGFDSCNRVVGEGIIVWTPNDDTVEDVLGIDAILDGINLHSLTNRTSSTRYYWKNARASTGADLSLGLLDLPMSGTVLPKDQYRTPRH